MLIIDAGNLPRFMQCNGNILLQADPVFSERDTTVRDEGNAAHWLASMTTTGTHTVEELVDRKAPNGVYITADMAEHVHDYLSAIDRDPYAVTAMEHSYSINGPNWQINGRPDHFAYNDYCLNIDDFKYGYSIVEPEMNWTLIAHAIGICIERGITPQQITFTIHQPRAPHRNGRVRFWQRNYAELLQLYNVLSATLANPSNMLQTGPNCYKCPSFVGCVARQDALLNAIEVAHVAYRADIDNDDLAERMDEIRRAEELLKQSKKAYEEQALHRLKKGEIIANYAAENDLANTSWKEHVTPELILALTGQNISKQKLPTPNQAKQAGLPAYIVDAMTERKHKGTKLARISANKKAEKLFGAK